MDIVPCNFSRIDILPFAELPSSNARLYYIAWWTIPSTTFLFVVFFTSGQDAMEDYRKYFIWFWKTVSGRLNAAVSTKPTSRLNFAPMSQSTASPALTTKDAVTLPPFAFMSPHTHKAGDLTDTTCSHILSLDPEARLSSRSQFREAGSIADTASIWSTASAARSSGSRYVFSDLLSEASSPASDLDEKSPTE